MVLIWFEGDRLTWLIWLRVWSCNCVEEMMVTMGDERLVVILLGWIGEGIRHGLVMFVVIGDALKPWFQVL